MLDHTPAAFPFEHKNNIKVGNGRVLWDLATTDISGIIHPAGWVLPGGMRTASKYEAHAAATEIDRLISGA